MSDLEGYFDPVNRRPGPSLEKRREAVAQKLAGRPGLIVHSRNRLYLADTVRPGVVWFDGDNWSFHSFRATEEARRETDLPVEPVDGLGAMLSARDAGAIYLERRLIPASMEQRVLNQLELEAAEDLTSILIQHRMVKDEFEWNRLREAGRQSDAVHREVPKKLEAGMTELELAGAVEGAARREGHEGILVHERFDSYLPYGLIASGENLLKDGTYAYVPHGTGASRAFPWSAGRREIGPGEPVVVDIGGVHYGYNADVSRTYTVGNPEPEVEQAFADLKAIFHELRGDYKPGVTGKQLYELGIEYASDRGRKDQFQGTSENRAPFVGHGVGLSIDESPVLGPRHEEPIQAGMSLTLELWLRLPEYGAVKLEDTLLVGENGNESISSVEPELGEITV